MRRRLTAALGLLLAASMLTIVSSADPAAAGTDTSRVSRSIRVAEFAEALALAPDGTRLYVTSTDPNRLSVIDTATSTVSATWRTAIYPIDVAVSPDGRRLYVAALGDHVLQTLDATDGRELGRVPLGEYPSSLVVSPDGARAYVTDNNDMDVTVVDLAAGTVVTRIPLRRMAEAIAISPDGTRVYALLTERPSVVAVIDTATNRIVRRDSVGDYASRIATSADGRALYVTTSTEQSMAGTLVVLDAATGRLARRIPLGVWPRAVTLAADGTHVLVSSAGGHLGGGRVGSGPLVTTVDPGAGAVLGTRTATGAGARAGEIADLVANPSGPLAYGTLGGTRYVTTFAQTPPPTTPGQPRSVRITRTGTRAAVTWQPPSGSARASSYSVVAVPVAEGPQPARSCTTTVRTCRLTGLLRGVDYQVLVQARNAAGWSPAGAGWSAG